MKSFLISQNDGGQRVDKFITKAVPLLPKSLMYKYLRTKRIKLNGKKTDIAARLQAGDVLELYINDEFFAQDEKKKHDFLSAPRALDIVYEDENIMILNKKAGVLCHPDDNEYVDTLIARVKRYLYEKGEYDPDAENSFTPSLANRIDRNTGGLVLAAKNAGALRVLNQKIKDREITKKYKCIAIGEMPKKHDILTGYLRKDSDKNKVFISNKPQPDGKIIRSSYTVQKIEVGNFFVRHVARDSVSLKIVFFFLNRRVEFIFSRLHHLLSSDTVCRFFLSAIHTHRSNPDPYP